MRAPHASPQSKHGAGDDRLLSDVRAAAGRSAPTSQGALFDPSPAWDIPEPPRARASDPSTSHEAAAKAVRFANDHRSRILEALTEPLTVKEIAIRLEDIDHVAVARRMCELERMQLAEPTGVKRQGCREWRRKAAP